MVIVVVVFVVVVVLVPLHHLRQPPLVEQQPGQVPHLLLLHHWPRPVALTVLRPLLVLAVGGGRLVGRGLAGERRGRGGASTSRRLAADLRGGRAAMGFGRANAVFPRVLPPKPGEMKGVHCRLRATVVGVGVAIFRFMGAGASLVGRAGLRFSLRCFCGGGCGVQTQVLIYMEKVSITHKYVFVYVASACVPHCCSTLFHALHCSTLLFHPVVPHCFTLLCFCHVYICCVCVSCLYFSCVFVVCAFVICVCHVCTYRVCVCVCLSRVYLSRVCQTEANERPHEWKDVLTAERSCDLEAGGQRSSVFIILPLFIHWINGHVLHTICF